jgi:hypothetical protein
MPNLFQNLFPQRREYRSIVDSIDQSMRSVDSTVSKIQTLHYNAQESDVNRFTNDQLVNEFHLAEARLEILNTFHELERNATVTGQNAHRSLTAMLPRSRTLRVNLNIAAPGRENIHAALQSASQLSNYIPNLRNQFDIWRNTLVEIGRYRRLDLESQSRSRSTVSPPLTPIGFVDRYDILSALSPGEQLTKLRTTMDELKSEIKHWLAVDADPAKQSLEQNNPKDVLPTHVKILEDLLDKSKRISPTNPSESEELQRQQTDISEEIERIRNNLITASQATRSCLKSRPSIDTGHGIRR